MLLFGYIAYTLAEAAAGSGIAAALAAGFAAKRYAYTHMSTEAKQLSKQMFHLLAWLFEALIFFLVGTSAAAYVNDINLLCCTVVLLGCLLSRAANIFGLGAAMNLREIAAATGDAK